MDVPEVWGAVEKIEAELFSGLIHLEPADPRPGDSVKFVLPGERAEQLIEEAGNEPPSTVEPHQCGPECIRPSRKISRAWRQYLAEWEKEGATKAA
jgi:hypothetical protein